ncbi:MAG TPA: hypothetical protein VJ565_01380, partial [Dehalococcoidia bacterium]|nr:hypothetical protein [Dehalococcoidia bacterium]
QLQPPPHSAGECANHAVPPLPELHHPQHLLNPLPPHLGGDIIRLRTASNEEAAREIGEHFHIQALRDGQELSFEVARGSEFIPALISRLKTPVLSITVRRPTLDDVFLKLTGRDLRDREADATEGMKTWARRARRRGRRG